MEIPVLIEPVAGDGYLAKTGEPLPLSAAGASRDEALRNLRQMFQQRMQSGSTIAFLNVGAPTGTNPWAGNAGMFKDNPLFDDVVGIMAENRKMDDADPDYL